MPFFEILLIIGSYFLGSIPFGIVITRIIGGPDPRSGGSGNIGATNVTRLVNKTAGAATLFLDAAKGWLSVTLALNLLGTSWSTAAVGMAVFLGHCYSIFLFFKGGKGVATTLGILLAVSPLTCFGVILIWAIIFLLSNYVWLGSILSCLIAPIILLFLQIPISLLSMVSIIAILIMWRHRKNISYYKKNNNYILR